MLACMFGKSFGKPNFKDKNSFISTAASSVQHKLTLKQLTFKNMYYLETRLTKHIFGMMEFKFKYTHTFE